MKKIIFVVILLLGLIFTTGVASASWTANSSMKAGILYTISDTSDYFGGEMHPTTFYDGDTLKVFFGASWPVDEDKPGRGWEWTGSTWIEDTSLINGLSNVDDFKPEIFTLDGTIYMIGGTGSSGAPNGWKWSGSQWDTYATIANGLTQPHSEVFWTEVRLK